ncbi:MAG: hypothetical protein H6739_07545 [Alphaproteobacteria bacterium]|nr:hypothetical protein [Alphaproteobacteria bacterium]
MEALLRQALLGTAQLPGAPEAPPPLDALVAQEADAEWRLLLAAGAWASWRRAGHRALPAPPAPPPAQDQDDRPCSPAAEALLLPMLQGQGAELLPEALDRLIQAQQCVSPALLPDALSQAQPLLQEKMRQVLGARGRWLAAQNPRWSWAVATPAAPGVAALRALWEEGSPEERVDALEQLRHQDPTQARVWLRERWTEERAEGRARLLAAMLTGLSMADEPFLETLLDDRSARVRARAATLLSRLPGSQLVARMRARTLPLLQRRRGGVISRLVGPQSMIAVRLPDRFGPDMARDGLTEKGELGLGPRSWWLVQALGCVPPDHWAQHLDLPPDVLLEQLDADQWAVVEGLSRAAVLHEAARWILPLRRWWDAPDERGARPRARVDHWLDALIPHLPLHDATRLACDLLQRPDLSDANRLAATLEALPRPWPTPVGRAWLTALKADLPRIAGSVRQELAWWELSIADAGPALPLALVADARPSLPPDILVRRWRAQLEAFDATLDRRLRLAREILP